MRSYVQLMRKDKDEANSSENSIISDEKRVLTKARDSNEP